MTRFPLILVVVISAAVGAIAAMVISRADRSAGNGQDARNGRFIPYDSVTGLGATQGRLVSRLDYFESGRRLTQDYLTGRPARNGATLWDVAESCAAACVRVEVEVGRKGEAVAAISGSGVIVAGGGYVLTAGHAFDADKVLAIRVILPDARALGATLAKKDFAVFNSTGRDWAVLKLGDDRPTDLVALKLGRAERGMPVIALGYPAEIGLDEDGRIAYSRKGPLAPLYFPAHVSGTDPIALTPAAGAVPVGGMSGGPVVNAAGEVVGIFVSVSRTPRPNGMRVSYGATPVAALEEALGRD